MKRQILTTLSIVIFIALQAQNYECIKPDAEYYFTDSENYHAVSIDSTVQSGDTLTYFQYQVMSWIESIFCFTRFGPSWIGRKISQLSNGDFLFFNQNNDAILIKTQAQVNEIWAAYTYENGDYFQAKVVSVEVAEFLGIQDSIKKIGFLLKDINGNNLTHVLNNTNIQVSKNYGLVKTFNFKLFPDYYEYMWGESNCHSFTIAGISEPANGVQNLTAAEIFDIDVGDEIHIHRDYWFWVDYTLEIKTIHQYIDKSISTNGDTLIFTIKRCARKTEYSAGAYTLSLFDDTISQQIVLSELSYLDMLFGQTIVDSINSDYWEYSINSQRFYKTSDRRKKDVASMWYSEAPHDCIQMIITKDKTNQSTLELGSNNFYIEGLGGPYHDYADFGVDINEVSYFKKGDDEWGTPYNCDSLLVNIKPVSENVKGFTITPNPMKEMTKISIAFPEYENLSLNIYNLVGVKVYEKPFKGTEMVISKGELPAGVYVVTFSTPGSLLAIRKLIVE